VPATVGAMVGHSLGGDIALGVADDPPPGLRAVVLVDGGYLEPVDRVELGAPDAADREAMVASMRENEARFPDWETARGEIAKFVGTEELTPETEAAFRESLTEIDGELREAAPPERAADLLMSIASAAIDVRTRASRPSSSLPGNRRSHARSSSGRGKGSPPRRRSSSCTWPRIGVTTRF
jgi:pimeloyl-ACP methyl ester carboxylesterase